jgi:hypothetical protein
MKIRITKEVTFKDWTGTGAILRVYKVGDIIEATADGGHYWITSMGGIYKNEAELVESS